ncbi:hypothetical protein DFH06DRAFT_1034468 [Mycena polygramma]|nr:hypothetical protein DFH06DRAFT_1034468 [Mycena polygramma]
MILSDDDTSPPPYELLGQQADNVASFRQPKARRQGGTELRYVYYRVFAPDGAIPSKTASDPNDPLIGRLKALSVPPPLNAASLKRTLAQAERIADPMGLRADLYRLPSDQTPMDDSEPVSILGPGIASTPADAVALVFIDELSDEERQEIPPIQEIPPVSGSQYVYYRLHTRSGEDSSRHAFDSDEPSVGRIDRALIAPPQDALAVKHCIARAEGMPIYAFADLYTDVSDALPLENDARIAISAPAGDFHGSSSADAIRIVQPERRPGLYNRPFKITVPQAASQSMMGLGTLPVIWLNVIPGEVVYTDGVIQMQNVPFFVSRQMHRITAYTVVNSSGAQGLISTEIGKFFDTNENINPTPSPSSASPPPTELDPRIPLRPDPRFDRRFQMPPGMPPRWPYGPQNFMPGRPVPHIPQWPMPFERERFAGPVSPRPFAFPDEGQERTSPTASEPGYDLKRRMRITRGG